MKQPFLILLFVFTSFICKGQGNYGYVNGLIVKKQGDTMKCWVERAVTYRKDFYYKLNTVDTPKIILTENISSIILPYLIVDNVKTGNRERMLNLIEDGKIKLYNYVREYASYHGTFAYIDEKIWLFRTYSAATDYYLKTNDSLYHIKKSNFYEVLISLMKDCDSVIVKLRKEIYKFDDLDKVIQDYNRCDETFNNNKLTQVSDTIYTLVDTMPHYIGGDSALSNLFTDSYDFRDLFYDTLYHLTYKIAIDKSGRVAGINTILGNVVKNERLIRKIITGTSGKWMPGKNNDSIVNVYSPLILIVHNNKIVVYTSPGIFSYQRGDMKDGYKIGIWEYYDASEELTLKVDYSSGKLIYIKQDTSDYVIKENDRWVQSKLDIQPRYIGSMVEFNKIIQSVPYPEQARRNITTGTQYISFEIDTMGRAGNFTAVNDIGDHCAKTAIEAVKLVPNVWLEASKDKRKYISKFILPVKFIIQKSENAISPTKNEEKPDLPLAKMLDEVTINLYDMLTGKVR